MINERRAFGDRLRRQRERQHVTLATIAHSTKVAASLFAALERGDCSRWPGGVYNRAFVRGYAKAIGLDPDEVAAEFAECYETTAEVATDAAPKRGADAVPRQALRLGLVPDPREHWVRAVRAVALTLAELLGIGIVAAIVVLGTGIGPWTALAITSVGYHVVIRIGRALPFDRLLARRSDALPLPEYEGLGDDEETPVSSAASTVA